MIGKFCRECGTKLEPRELEHEGVVPYCPTCGQFRFPQYNVAVSMIVVNEEKDEILLIQQYGRPTYILVAGYVSRGEGLEEAVIREVKEETGLTVSHMKFNRTQFFEESDTLMCNFTAFVKNTEGFDPNYEIDSCKWFSREGARANIRPNSLAEFSWTRTWMKARLLLSASSSGTSGLKRLSAQPRSSRSCSLRTRLFFLTM
jgi:NAD+ diphosphatase